MLPAFGWAAPVPGLDRSSPETVAAKILRVSEVLGGLSRITFQMSTASLETAAMKRSIELLGTEVAPIVRERHRTG